MSAIAGPTTARAAKGESRAGKAIPAAAGRSSRELAERERSCLPLNPASIPTNAECAPPEDAVNPGTEAGLRLAALPMVPLQRKLLVGRVNDPIEAQADAAARQVVQAARAGEERPQLQPDAGNSHSMSRNAPPIVHEVLRSLGQPLDADTLHFMEPRFGTEFGPVRIHTGERAAASAQALNARAYAAGRSIVFGAGEYQPHTTAGRELMGHELAHVVQQTGMPMVRREPQPGAKDDDKAKQEQGGGGARQPAPVNDISDNPMHEEREITAFDVTPGNKRPWNLNKLTKTIVTALQADERAYIRVLGVYPTIAGEDEPKQNAFERADTVRRALIQWIGPGKFSEDRFDVAFADGQVGDPQIKVDIAYKGKVLSNPTTPSAPGPGMGTQAPETAPAGQGAGAKDADSDLSSAVGGQWTWHMNRPGKVERSVQVQLTRGSGAAQAVYQFGVNLDTGDIQALAGGQLQQETRTVEVLKSALKVKASVFIQLLGGVTRAKGDASGSITFQVQAGAQVTAIFGPVTVAIQAAPSITFQAGQPIALDFNLAPQGGQTTLPPSKALPPFIGIPIIVGTF
jgi:hypothetical protein